MSLIVNYNYERDIMKETLTIFLHNKECSFNSTITGFTIYKSLYFPKLKYKLNDTEYKK